MAEYKVVVTEEDTRWFNLEGKLHREDGPAFKNANGDKWYYLNGKLHRENGPAIEYTNGKKSYYINGKYLTEQEFQNRNKP